MTDHSKILKHIETLDDRDKLKLLIQRAREQGAKEVAEAAFRKLISLVPEAQPGTLVHDFRTTIHAFEHILSEERGRTTRLSRTRQKVKRVGVRGTLTDWAYGKQTEGFDMLIERRLPDLTGEAIVVRHTDHFADEVVAAACARLSEIGYVPPEGPAAAETAD